MVPVACGKLAFFLLPVSRPSRRATLHSLFVLYLPICQPLVPAGWPTSSSASYSKTPPPAIRNHPNEHLNSCVSLRKCTVCCLGFLSRSWASRGATLVANALRVPTLVSPQSRSASVELCDVLPRTTRCYPYSLTTAGIPDTGPGFDFAQYDRCYEHGEAGNGGGPRFSDVPVRREREQERRCCLGRCRRC